MSTLTAPTPDLGELLAGDDYVRRRLEPRWGDLDYLVLKDLRQLVERLSRQAQGRVFDYGCGAAPYRTYFRHCAEYIGADVTPGPHIDRLLGSDGRTSEPAESYDVVLSTQVLEHVQDPVAYLEEAYRILRPGGRLILSTHGMVEEHGCPFDFHRWTSRGLENLVRAGGFEVTESVKFTAEIRAVVQLLHQFMRHLHCPESRVADWILGAGRRSYRLLGIPLLNWLADRMPQHAILPASHPASLYVGICVVAAKSTAPRPCAS